MCDNKYEKMVKIKMTFFFNFAGRNFQIKIQ